MQNYYSIPEFAGLLRQTYPDLFTDIDDDQFIVRNWLSTYPDFLENINEDDLYEMFPEHQPPVAAQTYERYGQGAVAPFWDRVGHGLKGMGVDVVAAAADIAGVDGARDWSKKVNREWMKGDPSLQAYMLWREDEPVSMDNFMDRDLIMRGLSEMLPSYIAMTGAAAAAYAAALPLVAAGTLAGTTGLVTAATMGTIGTLEASGEYMQARDILEEKGVEESEAKITAGLASLTYGIIAGFLESLPFFHAVRNVPGLRSVVRKGMHGKLMTALTEKAFSKGLGSESFWLKWASRAGRFGTEALDGMFTEAVTEGLQGLSQEVINWGLENGFGKTPEEVMQNIWKATSETYKSQEIIEQMYGGAIGGGIFSGIGGATPTLARTSKDQADAITDQVRDTREKILEDIEQRVAEPVSIERQAEMMVEAQEEYGVSENVEQVEQELFRLNAAARALGFDGIKHLNLNWDTPNAQGEEAQQLLKDHGALSNFIGENLSPEEVAQISKGSGLIQNWEWQRSGDKPIVKKGNIEKILDEIKFWIASGDDIVNPDSDSFRPYTNVVWSKDEKKNADVKKQIDDLIAAAAPSVTEPFVAEKEGAGDFTAVGFLGSLAVSAPIYSYGSQELSTNPVAAAAEATKDVESFYEKGIKFIQELGDTSAIQKLPDDVRVSYLHGIGRWLKEVGILPEAAAINGNEIRQILELFAKGDAKIETVIQELEEGETGSIKQLQVKKSKATGLVKNIQNMSEGIIYTKEDWAELNIQSMAEEAAVTPETTAAEPPVEQEQGMPQVGEGLVQRQVESPVPEAPPPQEDVSATAQQVEIEQKMEMMPVGSQVIVTLPKYKNKPGVVTKISEVGQRYATVKIEGVEKEQQLPWNFIEPSVTKTPTTVTQVTEGKVAAPPTPTEAAPPIVTRQKLVKRRDLKANPDVQYLFGDNLAEKGKGGQAKEMRGEPNAIGIPTKKRPSMGKDAFFTDKELAANKKAIDKAFAKIDRSKPVVIPSAGLGTGLAGLKSKAPKTFEYLESKIAELESPIIEGLATPPPPGAPTTEKELADEMVKEEVHPAIIAERKRLSDEWYAKQEKAPFRNLYEMAKEHKIHGRSGMNRAQLLKALKNIPPTKLLEELFDLGETGQASIDKLIKDWEAKQEKAPAVPPATAPTAPSRISSSQAPQAIAKFFTPIRDSIKGKMAVATYMKTLGPRLLTGKVEFLRNKNKPNEFLLLETTSAGTRVFGYISDKKASLMGRQDMYGFKLNNIYQQGEVYGLVGKAYLERNYGLTWEGTIGGDERPFVTSITTPAAPASPVAAPAKSRTLAVSFGMLTGARVTVDGEGNILEIVKPPIIPTPPGMDLVGMHLDDLGYTADQVAQITEMIKTSPTEEPPAAASPPKTEATKREISKEDAMEELRAEAAKSKKQKVNKKKSDIRKEIDKRQSSSSRDDDNTSAFVDVSHPKRKQRGIFLLKGKNKSETRKIRKIIFNRLRKKMPFIKPLGSGFVVNAGELSDGVLGESLGNLVHWANTTVEGEEASLEVIPHEYFHAYWRLLGETSPIVRKALKEFGAEAILWAGKHDVYKHLQSNKFEAVGEYIANAIGQVYARKAVNDYTPSKNAIQKIKLWLERMWRKLRSIVRPSSLTKDDVVKIIAEQFYDDAPMEMGTRGASISKEVRKRYRNKYSKERMNALKSMRARNAVALFAADSADYSSTKEDESEMNYEDWALGSEQDADFEYKKFLETGMRVWGAPVTREEFNNIVATAKTIESNTRLSVKDKRNAFKQYILEGTWAPKEKQSRILAHNKSLRDQGKTASTFLRNIIQRVYVQANNTIDRASKVFLEITDGKVDVQKGETVTGRKLSKNVRKSFLDWMPIGKKTAYIKFSDINRSEVIEEKGKDDLTIWINTGSRWVESNFDKLEKQLADLQYALVGAKGGDQSTLILVQIDDWIDIASNKESILAYFESEQESGNVSAEDIANWGQHGKEQEGENPNVWAQIIARHEWWKEVYGSQYLREQINNPNYKGLQDDLNRTRGPLAEGWLPLGWTKEKGTYNTVLVDPSEVEMRMVVDGKEKVISMEEDFLGVGKKRYRLDGFMALDSEGIGNVADAIGRRPEKGEKLTEFKPYIYHNGANGMVIEKMNMSEAPVGLRIVNKKTKAPIISVRDSNGKTEYYFHNQDGTETRINSWASREETKKSSGTFNQTNTVLELPESSLTVISAGDETGKRSVAFPMNWMDLALSSDLLADEKFLEGYKIIAKWLLNNAKQNIRHIVKMRSNPSKLKAALMEIGVIQDKATSLEKELIKEIDAAALLHPAFMKRHAGSILNLYMKQYAFKGRKDGNGSYVAMAPDFADEMAVDEIIYGDANRTLVRLTAQEAYDTVEEFQDFWARYRKTREREGAINELNAILETKEILHMRSRQPVVDIQALDLRRVKRIEYDGGNRVFVNAIDTFKWLQGDFDGDHLQIQVLGERELQGMKLMLNSEAVKNRVRSTRLELFQHSDFKGSLSSFSDMSNVFSKISKAHSSQGIINNAKQIRELLSFKNLRTNWEIGEESVEVEMVPSDEVVTLDYAPLDKSIVSRLDVYKSLKNEKIEVVNEAGESLTVKTIKATDGPVFLRTTSAHEASILLQASVDNVKEMLLPEWGYNGYDFMIRRFVRRTDGEPLTDFQVNVYNRDIFNAFKYSSLRRGREMGGGGRTLNMMELYAYSKNHEGYNTTTVEDIDKVTKQRMKKGSIKDSAKNYLVARLRPDSKTSKAAEHKFLGVTMDTVNEASGMKAQSLFEDIMPILYREIEAHLERHPNDAVPAGDIFSLSNEHIQNAHYAAINAFNKVSPVLAAEMGLKPLTDEEYKRVKLFTNEMANEYYNIFINKEYQDKHGNTYTMGDKFVTKYEYSEALGAFIDEWLPKLRAESNTFRYMSTLHFLNGVLAITNKKGKSRKRDIRSIEHVYMLLPFELMEKPALLEYFRLWGENLFEVSAVKPSVKKDKETWTARASKHQKEYEKSVCK